MTREEAIKALSKYKEESKEDYYVQRAEALNMAIKALDQEPCDDCINRQAVIEICNEEWDSDLLVERIMCLPPVNPQPKTGHWILAGIQSEEDIDNDNYRYICSECQHSDIHAKDIEVPYCWNCGAKMEGEEKE